MANGKVWRVNHNSLCTFHTRAPRIRIDMYIQVHMYVLVHVLVYVLHMVQQVQ